jgi:hypothetical protein
MGAIADIYGKSGYALGFSVFVILALASLFIIYELLKKIRVQTN